MGKRLMFLLGLASAVYGAWLVHREGALNAYCNAMVTRPTQGFSVPSRCLNIVWPYAEGFVFAVAGGLFVFAGLVLSRRAMAGERRYQKELKLRERRGETDYRATYGNTSATAVSGNDHGAREDSRDAGED